MQHRECNREVGRKSNLPRQDYSRPEHKGLFTSLLTGGDTAAGNVLFASEMDRACSASAVLYSHLMKCNASEKPREAFPQDIIRADPTKIVRHYTGK